MSRRIDHIGRSLFLLPLALGAVLMLGGSPARAADDAPRVAVLPTSGVVDAIMAGYLADGIAKAHRDGADAVVITLHTPGGALDQTRRIVMSLLDAPVPTIVWSPLTAAGTVNVVVTSPRAETGRLLNGVVPLSQKMT